MSATINTFPPFQSMNSPRGWMLAAIVLLHIGFFFLFSTGMMPRIFAKPTPKTEVVVVQPEKPVDPPKTYREYDPTSTALRPDVAPPQDIPVPEEESPTNPRVTSAGATSEVPPAGGGDTVARPAPVILAPQIDPMRGLSEPTYPSVAIRNSWEGTVTLSVEVLTNGRVGEVRLEDSSGYAVLDEAAMRQAKRWRLKPGTRDGAAASMWKTIPIKFELKERGTRF